METPIDTIAGDDRQIQVQETPPDEAEPVKLTKQGLISSEADMHDKILVGKRGTWYDDEGNVLCGTISTRIGNKTSLPDGDGNLVPSSP